MAIWNKISQAYLQGNKTLFEAFVLADKDGNIINQFGVAYNIPIAAGDVDGYTHINKFGASSDDIASGTIWDGNGVGNADDVVYPYPADSVIAVTSASNVGAAVWVEGLDASYHVVSETINIGDTGATVFSRVFRARMVDTVNDADVSLTIGGTEAARIIATKAQTLMAVYTVPAGKTAYLIKTQMGSDKASTNSSLKYTCLLYTSPSPRD